MLAGGAPRRLRVHRRAPLIGQRLGHYRVLSLLGEGGMGVVYRARDEHLEREVAIKVLPAGALVDDEARRRFRKEALALSRLQHPNVGVVHDFDSQDGIDYLVMELVPGEGLDARISHGSTSEAEVLQLGEQLAEGLAAAHASGVLHRDVKPQNLRLTPDGQLKLLDFGLATALPHAGSQADTDTVAGIGALAGTVPYMSPEQLRGERPDERSDVHAAGVVLYELACGRHPFARATVEATMLAVLRETPPLPSSLGAEVSPEFERIVCKCLEKPVRDRYQSARDLAVDLRRLARRTAGQAAGETVSSRRVRRRAPWAVAAVASGALGLLAAVVAIGIDAGGIRSRLFGDTAGGTISLAVLPLNNLSGDPGQENFADGMTDELITRLAQVRALRVISRTSSMQYKGSKLPLHDIARELGVKMIVEGSVLRAGDMVRISAQLVEARSDHNVWASSYEKELRDVLRLQSEVAGAVVENVRVRLTPAERTRIRAARRVDPEAFELYLRGVAAFNRQSTEGYRAAVANYEASIARDPSYAPAFVGLAQAFEYMSGIFLSSTDALPKARAALDAALRLEPENGEAHAALGYSKMGHDWDWDGAERSLRHALELSPNSATAHQNYGVLLLILGRFDESIRELNLAREIDPVAPLTATMSLWPLFEGHRWDEAVTKAGAVSESFPTAYMPRMVLGQAQFFRGERAAGIESLRLATTLDPGNPVALGWLGYAHAVAGQRAQALAVLDTLRSMQPHRYVQPYTLALIHIGLGERDQALELLERAVRERTDEVIMLGVDPAMDPLRSEPRFQSLLRQLGLARR